MSLSAHEQDLARVRRAIMHARRDRTRVRDGWVTVWDEQTDSELRAVIATLAHRDLDPIVERDRTLRRLLAVCEQAAPVVHRSSLVDERRVAPLGAQERTIDDAHHNRDLLRENHTCMLLGKLKPNAPCRNAVLAPDAPRKMRNGVDRRGRTLWTEVWEIDDPLTFNSAGTLRYEDSYSDAQTDDEAKERQALRRQAGLLYDAEIEVGELDAPDLIDVREDTDRDGHEVITSGEDHESDDYAPSITRKVRTHTPPEISVEPVPCSNSAFAPLFVSPDPVSNAARARQLDTAERRFELWLERALEAGADVTSWDEDAVLVYGSLTSAARLRPDPVTHPGQQLPKALRDVSIRTGRAPDGMTRFTAVDTAAVIEAERLHAVMRERRGVEDMPVRFTAPRRYDIPHPGEPPVRLVYDQPARRPHGSLRLMVPSRSERVAMIREWRAAMSTPRGRAVMDEQLAQLGVTA